MRTLHAVQIGRFHRRWEYRVRLILVPGLCLVLLGGCGAGASDDQGGETGEAPAVPVETGTVVLGDISASYEGTAALEAEEQAVVVAKTTGVVLEILAEEGDEVVAGQVLARLERDRYELEVARTKATFERLTHELERAAELHKRQLISAEDYDRARFEAEAQRAAYEQAALDLSLSEIRAPISGVVSERLVKVGNLVTQHQAVFRVDDFSPLWAVLHVPERELNTLLPGHPVVMAVDAYPGAVFNGSVQRIAPVVDATSGTFKVTTQFDDESGRLRPGLFGRVRIIHNTRRSVPLVSKDALLSEDGEHAAFVIDENQVAARREVLIGYQEGGMVEVVGGLETGDVVVTAGKDSLRDGAKVAIISGGSEEGAGKAANGLARRQ